MAKNSERKNSKKLNAGCLKIFQLIKLLYEDKAEYSSVIEIFKDEINEQSTNNIQVNINKYINTLKIFGMKIVKENHKFKLLSSLYSLDMNVEDLKSLAILVNTANNFPDKNLTGKVNEFVKSIELRMDGEDKFVLNNLTKNSDYDFSFYYSDIRNQIDECEKICAEKFVINLLYKKDGKEIRCKCTPKEVIYDSKTAHLKVYDSSARQNLEIPINTILSINMLPQRASNIELNTTVVYKLKNRLAKTYKLKENEDSAGLNQDGELIVINKEGNFEKLLHRLMRYSSDCELVSPKFLRNEMIKMINDTIENY